MSHRQEQRPPKLAATVAAYHRIRIKGEISVTPVESIHADPHATVIVLIGPTGAGKSSFIEALNSRSAHGRLGIAKNQLESATKHAEMYRVQNIEDKRRGMPIYVVDTPGLVDPKISEFEVLTAISKWRDECNCLGAVRALYFHPITDVRLASSKQSCIRLFKSFWGAYNTPTVSLVTTMWDTLRPEKRDAAEERFDRLVADHWGDWSWKGSKSLKFENTFESAMDIINRVTPFGIMGAIRSSSKCKVTDYGRANSTTGMPVVEELLRERIRNLNQQREIISEDLRDPFNRANDELVRILVRNWEDVSYTLDWHIDELEEFLQEKRTL
ncbi:hypothetical protein CVT24_004546 [Panaeolus cyanescens]|uniref:G domain-containing protein n=1 Tax=Panaeolus cyanescens TaxID=181874 RepID=A0A409W1E7_9AGAR|nr:hypothetical protein CVT24_004546 [Panaeolus cyanescens]